MHKAYQMPLPTVNIHQTTLHRLHWLVTWDIAKQQCCLHRDKEQQSWQNSVKWDIARYRQRLCQKYQQSQLQMHKAYQMPLPTVDIHQTTQLELHCLVTRDIWKQQCCLHRDKQQQSWQKSANWDIARHRQCICQYYQKSQLQMHKAYQMPHPTVDIHQTTQLELHCLVTWEVVQRQHRLLHMNQKGMMRKVRGLMQIQWLFYKKKIFVALVNLVLIKTRWWKVTTLSQ